jgi:hypothetical protein
LLPGKIKTALGGLFAAVVAAGACQAAAAEEVKASYGIE